MPKKARSLSKEDTQAAIDIANVKANHKRFDINLDALYNYHKIREKQKAVEGRKELKHFREGGML